LSPSWAPWSEWWINPGHRAPAMHGHPERVDDQLGAHVVGHRQPTIRRL
jgi:hypothetical protein